MGTLLDEFAKKGIERGGVVMFDADTAVEVIRAARRENAVVLGIDGFHLTTTTTQPDLEHSIDFSTSKSDITEQAIAFVASRATLGLYFEIVLNED